MAEDRAGRTTPLEGEFVAVDDTRTFLVEGAFTESMLAMALGQQPMATVRVDLSGRWNHGSSDQPVLIMKPDLAREWAGILLEAADASEGDLERWKKTGRAK